MTEQPYYADSAKKIYRPSGAPVVSPPASSGPKIPLLMADHPPTENLDGRPLVEGQLWLNTAVAPDVENGYWDNALRVWRGGRWFPTAD